MTSPPGSRLFRLDGRVAVVTGAAGRVGRVASEALAEAGARVVLNGRRRAPLDALAAELAVRGFESCPHVADVGDEDAVRGMADAVTARFGRLDVLVNNVTGNALAPLEEMTVAQWNGAMEGALTTMFLCTKFLGGRMAEAGRGAIVNVSSIYGNVSPDQGIYGDAGFNPSLVYATAKAGVLNFTRFVATYWADRGVRCNTLSLGGLAAPGNDHPVFRAGYERRTPLGRMAEDEDVKGPVVFLASDASRYVTGTNLVVDGGWTAW